MMEIQSEILESDVYSKWMHDAGMYLHLLMESQEQAIALLAHSDPDARIAAIGAFRCMWHFDDRIARAFLDLASRDGDIIVRYTAAASLILMHQRCKDAGGRLLLQQMLNTIVRVPCQILEIVADVDEYLGIMTPAVSGRTG